MNKESVIPFGASDSELMEATYFIPQGYHAEIEGNKVIIKKGEDHVNNDLEMIAKACDWLADNYSKYIITNGLATIFSATIDFDTIRMIGDFKKAMEE